MKKRNIVHSALSLSLTAALCLSMAACGGTQTPAAPCGQQRRFGSSRTACCGTARGGGTHLYGTARESPAPQAGR